MLKFRNYRKLKNNLEIKGNHKITYVHLLNKMSAMCPQESKPHVINNLFVIFMVSRLGRLTMPYKEMSTRDSIF